MRTYNQMIEHANIRVAVIGMIENLPEGYSCFKDILTETFLKNYEFFQKQCQKGMKNKNEGKHLKSPIQNWTEIIQYKNLLEKLNNLYDKLKNPTSQSNNIFKNLTGEVNNSQTPQKQSQGSEFLFDSPVNGRQNGNGKQYVSSETKIILKQMGLSENLLEGIDCEFFEGLAPEFKKDLLQQHIDFNQQRKSCFHKKSIQKSPKFKMKRNMKANKKVNFKKEIKFKRRFIKPTMISKHLYCTICTDIFNEPVRAKCGHTFCNECITKWIKKNKSPVCPICRQIIRSYQLDKDQIPTKIIADLEVFCINKVCPWRGRYGELRKHAENCKFRNCEIPEWLKKAKNIEMENEEDEMYGVGNDQIIEKINEHVEKKSLRERLFLQNQNNFSEFIEKRNLSDHKRSRSGFGSLIRGCTELLKEDELEEAKEEVDLEVKYSDQLEQLKTMGFTNKEKNILALVELRGDVNTVVNLLCN